MIIIRYESFENLEESKKQSIIDAGFQVFGEHGYMKSSVEEIVKLANISKGSLFYYFKSKKNFFLYLYEHCGVTMELLIDNPNEAGMPTYMEYTDFFERLNAIQLLKMKHAAVYPHMSLYMRKAAFETAPPVRSEIKKINERYTKERAMAFFQGIDYSKFKEGIDPMMILQLITWTSEGCANHALQLKKMSPNSNSDNTDPDLKDVFAMYQRYMKLFRDNFYKEEFL